MQPEINVNYLAIIVSVIVSMPLGYLWYGPIFGKAWAKHMGMEEMQQPAGREMIKSLIIYAIGSFLIAFVLVHGLEVWRPSNWNAGKDAASWVYALNGALWTWVGFFVPLHIARVAWEQKGWGLVGINTGFDLTRLLIFAFILAYWR